MNTKSKPIRIWRNTRILVQTFFVIFFYIIVMHLRYPEGDGMHNKIIFGFNPLFQLFTAIQTPKLLSIGEVIASLLMIIILGRMFCGWICPMGAIFDLIGAIKGRIRIINSKSKSELNNRIKADREKNSRLKLPAHLNFYILLLLIPIAIFKIPVYMLVEPITLFFRLVILAVLPFSEIPLRASNQELDKIWGMQSWWFPVQSFMEQEIGSYPRIYFGVWLFIAFMMLLFILDWHFPRFWCRFICPQGALFRLGQKFHIFRKRILPSCNNCQACDSNCHFCGSSSDDCFYCMDCESHCNLQAITFLPVKSGVKPEGHFNQNKAENSVKTTIPTECFSRRLAIQYIAGGVLLTPALKLIGPPIEPHLDFIRPPGVLENGELTFINSCIKCGQCIKICPTNALHPVDLRSGLNGLWSPRVIPRIGYCEYECNLCGKVCPSQAIPPMKLDDKKKSKIGTAYIDTNRCIPWISETTCGVCEEHCPLPKKAIILNKRGRPFVDVELCIGCGFCENKCPLEGQSAIRVFRKIVKPDVYM